MTTPAVGVSVIPLTHELDEIRALLRIADEGGLDLAGSRTTRSSGTSSTRGP
jgi:hypothetical protein